MSSKQRWRRSSRSAADDPRFTSPRVLDRPAGSSKSNAHVVSVSTYTYMQSGGTRGSGTSPVPTSPEFPALAAASAGTSTVSPLGSTSVVARAGDTVATARATTTMRTKNSLFMVRPLHEGLVKRAGVSRVRQTDVCYDSFRRRSPHYPPRAPSRGGTIPVAD